jgi:hypothetical protein
MTRTPCDIILDRLRAEKGVIHPDIPSVLRDCADGRHPRCDASGLDACRFAPKKEQCKGYMCSNDAVPTPTGGFDGFCASCQAHDEV